MRHLAALGVFAASAFAARAFAQNEITTFYGGASGVERGTAVAGGVDFDGDGWSDVIIGTPLASTGGLTENGTVHVISGQTGGVLFVSAGSASNDQLGFSAAVCRDVDADGTDDIIVGAPIAWGPGGPCGMARVISGATGATLRVFYGSNPGERFGYGVGGGFDSDGDGHADLIISAPMYSFGVAFPQIGRVLTYSGATGAELFQTAGATNFEQLGWSVAVVPDLNNDGERDFVIGAPGAIAQRGRVSAYDGTTLGLVATPLWSAIGMSSGAHFGWSIDGGFDPNNDGYGDLVVGAYDESVGGLTECGAVWVLDGRTGAPMKSWNGTQINGHFGASVAVIGDVNQNGRRDVLAGGPGAGYARVFDFVEGRLITVQGDAPGESFGGCVASAGDFDNDGEADFIVGAETASANGLSYNGYARVFSGRPWFANYCTAGVSTNGCVARMTSSGTPSVTTPNPFVITATQIEGGKSGLIFYGVNGRSASPWGASSSFLCVKSPTQRTITQPSGGTAGQCDGTIGLDWYGYFGAHPAALGAPFAIGQIVDAQCWYRDPPSPKTTNISDALEFALSP